MSLGPVPYNVYGFDFSGANASQDLHDPRTAKALFGEVLNNAGSPTVILAAPPIGYAWVIDQMGYSNPNAGGGTATMTVRLGTAGDIVDYRTIAVATPGNVSTLSMQGGLVAESSVSIEVTAGTGIRYAGTAWLVPLTKIRYWRTPALTNEYQTVTLPDIPTGYCLKMPWASMAAQSTIGWQWGLNLDSSTRIIQLRLTRGGVTHTMNGAVSSVTSRTPAGCPVLAAIISGDTLEAQCSTSPAASVFAGGAFVLVPLETRA